MTPRLPFRDRAEAGSLLGEELASLALPGNAIVLGLARGGVAVGLPVAQALQIPLDVLVVRKVGAPDQPELAIGAIAGGKVHALDEALIRQLGISHAEVAAIVARETLEAERREQLYRQGSPMPALGGRTVILVDDGLATGSSMLAAVRFVQDWGPAGVIVAVPVGSKQARRLVNIQAGACVCLTTPEPFGGVGAWYQQFPQIEDGEVQAMLVAGRVRGS